MTVNPVFEKDRCWKDGNGRAVYEAFVRTPGAPGRAGHFKFIFNGFNARSGIYQICSDVATGEWGCSVEDLDSTVAD